MVSNPANKNIKKRVSKEQRKKERFENYKNMQVLSSRFVREMEDELEERPTEIVSFLLRFLSTIKNS